MPSTPIKPAETMRPVTAQLPAEVRHLNQKQLARRWHLSHRTLERWRCQGQGPVWLKVGGRVLYTMENIQDYERSRSADNVGANGD